MNPLPRFLATALFIVLAALVALLVAPAWRARPSTPVREPSAVAGAASDARTSSANHAALLAQRAALALALVGVLLALALLVTLGGRARQVGSSTVALNEARHEIDTLSQLAATSAAQGAELNRERDVRRRAEEDVQLKQQLLTQSLEEKIRLGHDLHDGIIQSLYALGLTLETVRTLVQSDPAEADRRLEQTRAGLNNTIRDVRAYIVGLTPENLRRAGFSGAMRTLLGELGAGRGAQFEIQIDDEAAALLTPEQSIETLQIAREAVSNALRHGEATRITLRMHKSDREVCLLVQDNGRGFNAAVRRAGGHGLGNMEARATRVGASVRVSSQVGEGARVLATLPIVEPSAV